MIKFVNAKLNLGLNIVRRREDGYHDLETVFYPVGLHNGTPDNPESFCDILEITPAEETTDFVFTGRKVDCELEKNLVYKAWKIFKDNYPSLRHYRIALEKHIPDGAGLGGGSADAAFVLAAINEIEGKPFSDEALAGMALRLGADCPFFIYNHPCFASGVGEKIESVSLDLSGWWCLLVKPDIHISTKEAFAGISPCIPSENLKKIIDEPVEKWQGRMINDFEGSLFPSHPVLAGIKTSLLESGAAYSAMSGSGSTVFGLYPSREKAVEASGMFKGHFVAVCML
ncbi:MAG: 4-(cytidine 5'-diphospho)-2-C-methyl-D-erythritol kinase [Muribaculaceae bacterium]|nr:4-(cytidine 5'-diphospho)-2-C-methyl-D-erythritol kinase [Muribaculaceae bacterium]